MTDSFPRQQARTRRFSLGAPRSFQISPDGGRVAFLRSQGGSDPLTCLWVLDVAAGREHLAANPARLGDATADIPEQEKARRERSREQAGGIVAYATDNALDIAAFALAGEVWVVGLSPQAPARRPRRILARAPAYDPRPDPAGQRVAYVCDGALRVTDLAGGQDRELIGPAGAEGLTFGLAEFVAAEEMGRLRGYWWAPDGHSLLVARVDNTQVTRWHIADPANPARRPTEVAYPAAGTANADVSLLLVSLDGACKPVPWDQAEFPYLVTVDWADGAPLIVVQSRGQRRMRLLTADPASGAVTVVREDAAEHWLDIVPGVPARISDGRIVWTCDSEGAKRLLIATPAELADGSAQPVTPADLQVRDILDTDGDTVLFTASGKEPTEIGLWAYGPAGLARLTPDTGVHAGRRAGGTTVIISRSLAEPAATVQVQREGQQQALIASLAELPNLPAPRPDLFAAGERAIRAALLLPSWHRPGTGMLPVLLDPYGGPHAQRVLAAQSAFWTSQWFAEQGFAVLVADGRGTPGRGPDWDRAVAGDLAGPPLEDQVAALHAAVQRCQDLDTSRVAIRGWSFGGYLAALAVLRRPDVFHAAVAGAPVTEWRLYDTHYTERYLGHPAERAADYDASSLLNDAKRLRPALMIIHGLADDNVLAAHTLRLSAALLAAGRPHTVLPLSGVTHMTPQEEVAENLLLIQVDFLRRSLGSTTSRGR
jgi:dipeptidyl-peptidase-4